MSDIYGGIYDLIIGLFGGSSAPYFAESLCVIFSCFCVFFVLLIPFIVVWRILRLLNL